MDKQRKELEDKVNSLYKAKADDLEKSLGGKKSGVLAPLAKQDGALKNLLDDVLKQEKSAGQSVSPAQVPTSIKDLKKLFK